MVRVILFLLGGVAFLASVAALFFAEVNGSVISMLESIWALLIAGFMFRQAID